MSCQTIPAVFEVRWREIQNRRAAEPAVLAPSGKSLRTFEEVEIEAQILEAMFAHIPERSVAALDLANHPSWPALMLGAFRSKRILLPLDPSTSQMAKNRAEAFCGAATRITAGCDGELEWHSLSHTPIQWKNPSPDFLKISSGTGGREPRAVRFTTDQLLADCDQICETMKIDARDLHYGIIPFSHSYGLSSLVTPLLWHGVSLVAAQDPLPQAIATGIRTTGATVLPAIPAVFQALSELDPLPLRLCISAGAPLRSVTAKSFYKKHKLKIHSFYGTSECGGICYDASDTPVPAEGFIGNPLHGVCLEWDSSSGHIRVRSGAVGLGYHPEGQEKSLSEGYFIPEDLIEKCYDGFRIIGRVTDWINVGAKKVHPTEIERELLSHPSVRDAIVFGVESGVRGQQIHAVVASEEKTTVRALRQHCGKNLSAWQIPRYIHWVERIPTNARGKISRHELAEKFASLRKKGSDC